MDRSNRIDIKLCSATGKPVATSSRPVERNPEQEPPAKAGARVEGLKTSFLVAAILLAGAVLWKWFTPSMGIAASARFAPKACVDCHQKETKAYGSQKFVHAPVREAKCETCHKRHGIVGAVILEKESSELCYTCHAAQKQKFEQGKQHTAMKGAGKQRVGCTSCHNPHASNDKGLLKKTGNDLCFTCHKKDNFTKKVSHAPVIQSCANCHDPHGTSEANGLVKPVKALCQQCHNLSAPNFAKAHGGYPMADTACTNCHAPHGSNQAKILRDSVHAGMMVGCSTCHVDTKSKAPFEVSQKVPDLCLMCHANKGDLLKEKVAHMPFKGGQCTLCHSPHATDTKPVLQLKQSELCTTCHGNIGEAIKAKSTHMPAREQCTSCHNPHASPNARLLTTATSGDLCLTCHAGNSADFQRKVVHNPFAAKQCATCHNPHGSKEAKLLSAPVKSLCYTCHAAKEKEFDKVNMHRPVADGPCTACHSPHASDTKAILVKAQDQLCFNCHGNMLSKLKGTKMHPPFESGSCSICHVPHASSNPKLVNTKGSELCLICHSNVLGGKNIKSTHSPAKQDCAGCHDPHGSTLKTQLKKAPPDLCLACHAKLADVMKKPGAKVHPPAAMGQCTFCHKPHESAQADLLTSSPPGLCVTCHNTASEKIVQAHGGMQVKDANCVGCHDPHAAEGSKLFHPVQHKPFAGGVCTACHKK